MALSSASGAAEYDISATKPVDLSDELAEIIRTDNVSFLNRIGAGAFAATETKHQFNEDELNPNTATVTVAVDGSDSDTAIDVDTDEGARFKVGTLFKFNEQGKSEVCRVTSVSTDTLTISRGYGSTDIESHASGTTIMIVAHTKQESWKPSGEDWTQERSTVYNYLSTMGYGINISRRRQLVKKAGVPDEFAHQAAYRLKEFMRQLDSSIINSIRSDSAGGSSDYSSLGGLIEFASQSGGNTDSTEEDLAPSVVNALVKKVWDDGGMVAGGKLFLLCGGKQKRNISTFDEAYRRSDFNSRAAGYVVEKFITDLGFELEIIVDPWVPDDTILVGDYNRVKVGPLQGDVVGLEDLAKDGRALKAMLSGTYTAEFRNATEAFAIHTNLN